MEDDIRYMDGRPIWEVIAFLPERKYRVEYSEAMEGWHVLGRMGNPNLSEMNINLGPSREPK